MADGRDGRSAGDLSLRYMRERRDQMREIPRAEWVEFLDGFSRQHEGWLVTVEVFGAEIGAQVEAQQLPLVGITAELKRDGEKSISIIAGEETEAHITHTVTQPPHVRLEQTESGADAALQIESAD